MPLGNSCASGRAGASAARSSSRGAKRCRKANSERPWPSHWQRDGDTALIGGPIDNANAGGAWAFVDPPVVTPGSPSNVSIIAATLNGTVGAGGLSIAFFEYGPTAEYGHSTTHQSLEASESPHPIAAEVIGVLPGLPVHYRIVAENSGGESVGPDQTLTTAFPQLALLLQTRPCPPSRHRLQIPAGVPAAGARKRYPSRTACGGWGSARRVSRGWRRPGPLEPPSPSNSTRRPA